MAHILMVKCYGKPFVSKFIIDRSIYRSIVPLNDENNRAHAHCTKIVACI